MQIAPVFTDVIKIFDGQFCDAELHEARIRSTVNHFFDKRIDINLSNHSIPECFRKGVIKCRMVYSDTIHDIEYMPYTLRKIDKMAVIENNSIEYEFKYLDRGCFNNLTPKDLGFDEILIIKNGLVTDTSYSNVVFEDDYGMLFTPTSTLLNGTKRRKLIDQGRIKERIIKQNDIWKYRGLYLINAMIDIEDELYINASNLICHNDRGRRI